MKIEDKKLTKLTLTIPADIIASAKIAAIRRKTSVSKAVANFLRDFATERETDSITEPNPSKKRNNL